MLLLIFGIVSMIGIIKVINRPHKYWKQKGIRYVKPWPFFGYMAACIFRFKSFPQVLQSIYKAFPEQRYFGCYQFLTPSLLIRDPELIKRIMVKAFDVFPEHRSMVDPECDELWSKNLFAMPGNACWRNMRSTLSPSFTSSKIKHMFPLMKECANNFGKHFLEQERIVTVELKDATTKFANDVIASTVFGITCNSLKDPKNEFYINTFFGYTISSKLMKVAYHALTFNFTKFFKCRLLGQKESDFYRTLIKKTIQMREKGEVIRHDMIHLLLEACKGTLNFDDTELSAVAKTKPSITEDNITAQSILFFFARFQTVSLGASHSIYELALNKDVQQKLIEEIDRVNQYNDEITYETLLELKYLDMVVSESLRKWPPVLVTERKSVRPFTIAPEKIWEKTLYLDVGTLCLFPIYSIHRDAKNYPDPEKFDPERFSVQNKANIKPFTYLPFGAGPRNCIGSRFALLEIKTLIFYILSDFEIIQVNKTQNPLILSKKEFQAIPDGGFWVGLKPRHREID